MSSKAKREKIVKKLPIAKAKPDKTNVRVSNADSLNADDLPIVIDANIDKRG
jgi:hypothetical protein